MKSGLFRFFLRAVIVAAAFLAAELVVRARSKLDPPTIPKSVLARGIPLAPTRATLWTSPSPRASYNLSDHALRIMVIGDDNALARNSRGDSTKPGGESWPELLAKLYERATGTHEIALDVLAVPGFTAVQGEQILARALEVTQPDIVLLAFGPTNELAPSLGGYSDEYWLAHSGVEPHATPSRLLDAVRDFVEGREDKEGRDRATVRLDASRYERALERMIARVRNANACPAIVEPIARPYEPWPTRSDSFAELYRLAASRVAGVYGVPLIELRDALAADRCAFSLLSNRLNDRGARVVAREVYRGLATDSAFLLAVQRWLARESEHVESSLVAGTFGMLHSIYHDGPAALPSDAVREHIVAALQQGTGDLKRSAALLTALSRHDDASLEASIAAFDGAAALTATESDASKARSGPLVDQMRALARILLGRGEEARAILAAPGSPEPALDAVLLGIAILTAAPQEAYYALAAAIAADPSFGFADLWRAKLRSIANDLPGELIEYRIARTVLEKDGIGLKGISYPLPSDAPAIQSFMNAEPVLFGAQQRAAFPRLVYAQWVEFPTTQRDTITLLDRASVLRDAGLDARAKSYFDAIDAAVPELADDAAIELAYVALQTGSKDLARRCAARVRARSNSPAAAFILGILEYDAGAADRAIPLLREYLEFDPDQPRAMFYLALAMMAAGDSTGAFEFATRALELWPALPELVAIRDKSAAILHPK